MYCGWNERADGGIAGCIGRPLGNDESAAGGRRATRVADSILSCGGVVTGVVGGAYSFNNASERYILHG